MTFAKLLHDLVDAFGYIPYERLTLTWNPHLSLWEAGFVYWRMDPGMSLHPWGKTPEEAVRAFVSRLKGQTLRRTGQNGNWGEYLVKEEVTCDDVALTGPIPPPALVEGHNEVLPDRAAKLIEGAEKVYLMTYIGNRYLKGVAEEKMVEVDRDGRGLRKLLEEITSKKWDHGIEMGYYDGGKIVCFRGGLI
jgi:hypothetical protein